MRRLCSGKTLAFQAKDAGSIPARRSSPPLDQPKTSILAKNLQAFGMDQNLRYYGFCSKIFTTNV